MSKSFPPPLSKGETGNLLLSVRAPSLHVKLQCIKTDAESFSLLFPADITDILMCLSSLNMLLTNLQKDRSLLLFIIAQTSTLIIKHRQMCRSLWNTLQCILQEWVIEIQEVFSGLYFCQLFLCLVWIQIYCNVVLIWQIVARMSALTEFEVDI